MKYEKKDDKNKFNIAKLFAQDSENVDINRWRWLEASCYLVRDLLVIIFCFFLITKTGEWLASNKLFFVESFNADFLYSITAIPIVLSLTKYLNMFDCLFIYVTITDTYISVRRGFLTISYDKLYLKEIDNVELVKTRIGKRFGFSTVSFYSPGGWVSLPYIKNTKSNFEKIELIMSMINKKQNNQTP